MLHINTVHVQRETLWVKQLAGEQCRMICSAWACKHILLSLLWDCVHSSVWKVSSAHRGECVTTGGLYRPTHLCVAHFELHEKVHSFFLWCGKVGGCLEGGGGGGSMFQEVGVCMGFQRGAGWFEFRALTAWGKKLLSSLAEWALMLRYLPFLPNQCLAHLPKERIWTRRHCNYYIIFRQT